MQIPIERIITRLDEYLEKGDNGAAERHLLYWLKEAETESDYRGCMTLCGELMGFYRKCGRKENALQYAQRSLDLVRKLGMENTVSGATSYLNSATVYNFAGQYEKAAELYGLAKPIYESNLDASDTRLAGLYNNYATSLTGLRRFDEAEECLKRALGVLDRNDRCECDCAITYLNMADEAAARYGQENSENMVSLYCEKAYSLLKSAERDSYYAFVCGKCAPVFGYYGYFLYEEELNRAAGKI